ncbi:alpha/beta fold hydrolase [Altererythrobacter confluentis]|uniref:Alpha/beta fold hydrolase n=1 Tax=Allopontixanthobacter confluentis TaxID=1849021 RepID=A0A6L7GER4_9SPHN|nr:alpha/beta hydrolase [Allopontixanthobacter confluentis]MXP13956.1 alpha/beta fold hydrolase [Allopontixanthobacter confluentis]
MPYFETRDGTSIRYKELGEGRPVILIHGWPLSADSWDPVMMAMADKGMRAIAYDRRGFGQSDHAPTGYDYDTFSDDLADLIAALGLEENIGLAGFSMGGGEIARYMSRHSGKGITAAALVSSVVPYMLKTDDNPDGVPQETFDEMTKGMKTDFRAFFTGFFKDFYGVGGPGTQVSDEERHWAWQTTMKSAQWATLQSAAAFATTDFRPDVPHITVPTLVIHGTEDKTVPIDATGRAVASQLENATLIEYENEPHAVFATVTDRLAGDLVDFFSKN